MGNENYWEIILSVGMSFYFGPDNVCMKTCVFVMTFRTQNFNLLNVTLVNDSAAAVKIYFEKKRKRKL